MTDAEYKQLEHLVNKLSVHLKHPIALVQSVHDGWYVCRYATDGGDIVDSKMDFSIQIAAEYLIASDVTKKIIPHDIIG